MSAQPGEDRATENARILSTETTEETMADSQWSFIHNLASEAKWTPGLRAIFEYRDLGIKEGTKGDYVAHLIRHNGKKTKDEVQQWHVHDCTFQLVYVLNGWATFEYEGHGQRTIRAGDCILQTPGIKHRECARTTSRCWRSSLQRILPPASSSHLMPGCELRNRFDRGQSETELSV
jgi:mannose-6-phosphate isomerase-like protein (cupin superfamily)